MAKAKKERCDIQQEVTNTIITEIEKGTPPWRQVWTGAPLTIPVRHNGEAYRGINVLVLWIASISRGYTLNRWMTFKQAKELGGMVRKGEKSVKTVYYGTYERERADDDSETKTVKSRFAKSFPVFNVQQIDDLPQEYYTGPETAQNLGTQTDAKLDAYFAATGAKIKTTNDPRAYYNPDKDEVHMPLIETFYSSDGYFSVLAHEVIHWTGHNSRLDRLSAKRTKEAYAFEELVAELGACFLAVDLGFAPDFAQSASYIESWLTALKDDKAFIFKAAAQAQKAFEFIRERAAKNQGLVAA